MDLLAPGLGPGNAIGDTRLFAMDVPAPPRHPEPRSGEGPHRRCAQVSGFRFQVSGFRFWVDNAQHAMELLAPGLGPGNTMGDTRLFAMDVPAPPRHPEPRSGEGPHGRCAQVWGWGSPFPQKRESMGHSSLIPLQLPQPGHQDAADRCRWGGQRDRA
jgi:hypothetical protein